ncbi:MAG: autotransporter domain-containing protein [Betaproteobacteria bacterium]
MRKSLRSRSLALTVLGSIYGTSPVFAQSCPNYTLSSNSSTAISVTTANANCVVTINSGVTLNVTGTAVTLEGSNSSITNNGTITSNDKGIVADLRTIRSVINTGIINTAHQGIHNVGVSIDTINNSGTISSSSGYIAVISGDVTNLINTGTITGGASYTSFSAVAVGQVIAESITTFTNYGALRSLGSGYGIHANINNATIGTFNNGQGGNSSSDNSTALRYFGKLPSNYNIIVTSPTRYGQLAVTSAAGSTTIGIYAGGVSGVAASVLGAGTYSSVLTGISASNITGATTGTYGSYGWSLVNSSGSNWDLVVISNASGGESGNSTSSNMTAGGTYSLSTIGVTVGAVFDGGTLVLSSGDSSSRAFTVNSGGAFIRSPSTGTATLSGIFSGSGGLTFAGSGTTVMSGANTYTGGTTVSSGTLSVQGASPTGFGGVFVASGGTLMGTGTINGRMTVAGTLKPGHSPGYLATTNTVTMTSGSMYQQDIAGAAAATSATPIGATGYYSVLGITGGQFVINSGATLTPRLSSLFSPTESGYGSAIYVPALGDRFRVVTTSGGVSGRFSTLTQPAELAAGTQFLPFYNMAGSNSLDLAVIPTSYSTTIASLSGNKNAQSVGSALDQLATSSQAGTSTTAQDELLYAGSDKTTANLAGYTQSLAGEVYSAAVAVIAQTTQRVQQAVQARLGDTMGIGLPQTMTSAAGNTTAMGTATAVIAGGVPTAALNSNPAVNPAADAASLTNGNVWGELAYQKGNRSSDNYSGGWGSNLYQLVFGSAFYAENGMKLGGGVALSNTILNPVYGSGTIQQGSVFAYAKMPVDEYDVDAMASIGINSSDLSRSVIDGASYRYKSIWGNDALISLGLSRPIDLDSNLRITPFARVTWQMVTQSGVNEGGAVSALSVNRYTGNGVRGVLGIAAGSKANNPMTEQYTYRAYVGLGADSSGVLNPTLTASLAGMGTTIYTPSAGATFVQAGLYGTAKVADNAYAYAGLSGEARTGQTLGAVNIGLRIQF